MDSKCVFCKDSITDGKPTCTLYLKGSNTINALSRERNDSIKTVPGQKVHTSCRRDYGHHFSPLHSAEKEQYPTKPYLPTLFYGERQKKLDTLAVIDNYNFYDRQTDIHKDIGGLASYSVHMTATSI